MTFAGWSLAQVGLLFGIGALAITGMYLLRMRRRQVEVPFAALWARVAAESDTRKLWRKLRRLFSWLLQILLLALLCAALGDPRPDVWLRDPITTAIVVDRSASMAAPTEGDRTRLDDAKLRAAAEARALGPADRALVIAAGEEVSVVAPLSSEAAVLVPPIEALRPSHGEADLERALALADHAVSGLPGPRIVVITDAAIDPGSAQALHDCRERGLGCELVVVGTPAPNLAITAFAARRYPDDRDKVEVLVEVHNLGDAPAAAVLDVEAEGVSVGRRELQLQPGAAAREVLGDLDAARTRFTAKLEASAQPPSGFSSDLGPEFDDVAYAVVPPLQPLDVVLVTDGTNLFLEAALLTLGEHVRLQAIGPAEATDGTHEALREADLVVFDVAAAPLPAALPPTHVVVFDPWRNPANAFPIAKQREVGRPFLTEQSRTHPILGHVVLKDVNIARGTTFAVEPSDTVLVRSLGEPIAVLREGDHSLVAFGFDPRQSDLPLRVAFPILVDNLVRYIEQREPGFVASARLGHGQSLGLADLGLQPDGVTRVQVRAPDETRTSVPVERGRFRLRALQPGFYEITSLDGVSEGVSMELAVNQASVAASDLHARVDDAGLAELVSDAPPPDEAAIGGGPLWSLLVLLIAGLITIEWITYHRRVTV